MTRYSRRRSLFTPLALAAAFAAAACAPEGDAPEADATGGAAAEADRASAPAEGAAVASGAEDAAGGPTLRVVMVGLQVAMDSLHHALWREELPAVAEAATEVADHPTVSEAERQRIFGVLGEEAGAFRAADMEVHDAGVALAEAARGGVMADIQAPLARLHTGCVVCHEGFRSRLLEGGAPPP